MLSSKKIVVMRGGIQAALYVVLLHAAVPPSVAQSTKNLQTFFEQNIGLSQDQIDDIRHGIPVVKLFCLAQFTSTPRPRVICNLSWISTVFAGFPITWLLECLGLLRDSLT